MLSYTRLLLTLFSTFLMACGFSAEGTQGSSVLDSSSTVKVADGGWVRLHLTGPSVDHGMYLFETVEEDNLLIDARNIENANHWFNFRAQDIRNSSNFIGIILKADQPGTYPIKTTESEVNAINVYADAADDLPAIRASVSSGEITVEEINPETGHLKGTFSGVVPISGKGEHQIAGEFDLSFGEIVQE